MSLNGSRTKIPRSSSSQKLLDVKSISRWSIESVSDWLKSVSYEGCAEYFRAHGINGRALLMLDESDLKEIIKHNVGQRKNLYHLIRMLQINYNRCMLNKKNVKNFYVAGSSGADSDQSEILSDLKKEPNKKAQKSSESDEEVDEVVKYGSDNENKVKLRTNESISRHLINESHNEESNENLIKVRSNSSKKLNNFNSSEVEEDDLEDDACGMPNFCENCLKKFDHSPYVSYSSQAYNLPMRTNKGEKRKTFVSIVYLFFTCLWTSFMLTVVHDRVPDMQRYPPLPDLILDNVPLMPWAFFATEAIAIILLMIFLTILAFHKYRRICNLGGTIFFLRSITMLITSLSVPGIHIQCSSQRYGSLINKLYGAWNILSGVGLYLQGVRTCGDYMFSGHTVCLTLLSHFITEYTPNSMSIMHTFIWVLNFFGLFFILGAHEHYSIDVFVAFYITSRMFLYYHSLANNKVLFQRDHKRVKIWFPLFSYFEGNIHSIVPNEYQCLPNPFVYIYKFLKIKFKQVKKAITNYNNNKTKNIKNS